MELEQESQTTLRDDLVAAIGVVGNDDAEGGAPEANGNGTSNGVIADSAIIGETAEDRAERLRDEQGRFAKGADKAAPAAKTSTAKASGDLAPPQYPQDQSATPETVAKPQRPSTWKKDHWEAFDKLAAENPKLAEYINQRESEYAKGVSTYKAEADRAREIQQALEPFMPELQQHGIQPSRWISDLGNAHRMLAMGTQQQKMQMFAKLAQDYRVDLRAFAPQPQIGADGQPLPQAPVEQFMPLLNPLYDQVSQLQGQLKTYQTQQEQQRQAEIQTQITRFAEGKPHFEQVRETMAGLLQSGLAQDLDAAYEAAVRMPQHDDIFQAMQQQQREEADRKAAEARQANVARARNSAVSPKSGGSTGPKAATNGKTGLRDTIAENVEAMMGGRV